MRKLLFLMLLLLCFSFSTTGHANTETLNWCGTYFENNNQGYLRLPRTDLFTGSQECSLISYNENVSNSGDILIALDFTKNRSALSHWRKFDNHLLEIRGKFRNGAITGTRLVRDIGF